VRDLQRQRLHRLLQRRHLGLDFGKMLFEHLAPRSDTGVPLASKPGEGLHALDGHAVSRRRNRKASQSRSARA
jgi:hypothetical protein